MSHRIPGWMVRGSRQSAVALVLGVAAFVAVVFVAVVFVAVAPVSRPSVAKPPTGALEAAKTEHVFSRPAKGYDETRLMRFRYTATNPTNRTMPEAVVVVTAPAARTSQQQLVKVTTTTAGTSTQDAQGNVSLRMDLGPLAPYASAILTVTAEVAVATAVQPVPLPKGLYVGAEPFVETDAPKVVEAAQKVVRGEALSDPAKAARRLYDWIHQNIKDTGFYSRERGALWALEHAEGDCSEMAFAFVAMARASGVPARYVGGYVIESSALLTPEEFHNWAEWYDGKAWRIADPQKAIFDERPQRYIATRLFSESDARDLIRWKAETPELEFKMNGR